MLKQKVVSRHCNVSAQEMIDEIEKCYEKLCMETDDLVLQLSALSFTVLHDENKMTTETEEQKCNNNDVYEVREKWSWTNRVAHCTKVHLNNAAEYHQFFHEVSHYGRILLAIPGKLHLTNSFDWSTNEAEKFIKTVKAVLQELLNCKAKIAELYEKSSSVIPVHLRRLPMETPLRINALTFHTVDQVSVAENDLCLLLDNSDHASWRIRAKSGSECVMPAVLFVIPPPDSEAIHNAHRLNDQLTATWKSCASLVKQQARKKLDRYLSSINRKEFGRVNPSQRSMINKCLDDMIQLLTSNDTQNVNEETFRNTVEDLKNVLQSTRASNADNNRLSRTLQTEWNNNRKLLKVIEEFNTFLHSHESDSRAQGKVLRHLVNGHDDMKYVSMAYIERLPDKCKDQSGAEHMILVEKGQRIDEDSNPEEVEEEKYYAETITKTTEEGEMTSQTIKETETFVIRGVIDPRSGEEISIYHAITDRIISQNQGLYHNVVTGESMPIPEAMSKGLILVEYTNKSVEMGELIRSGIIKTITTRETVSYSVLSVTDPTSGHKISVMEAIKRGIIDEQSSRYINPASGESISVSTAIDKGLLEVKVIETIPNNDAVDVTDTSSSKRPDVVITDVLDPLTKKTISLSDATSRGLVDLEKGVYHDPTTGKKISLLDAAKSGYLSVKFADSAAEDKSRTVPRRLFEVLRRNDGETIEEVIAMSVASRKQSSPSVEYKILSKVKGDLDLTSKGIVDPVSGEELTLEQALSSGLLKMDPIQLKSKSGDTYSLKDSVESGLLSRDVATKLLRTLEPHSLQHLVSSGQFDMATGEFIDLHTGERIGLETAIQTGKLDPQMVFFRNKHNGNICSLSSAIENNMWNAVTGKLVDPVTGAELTPAEAERANLLDADVSAEKIVQPLFMLKRLKSQIDTEMTGIENTLSGKEISVEEAVLHDILDLSDFSYIDPKTKEKMTISEAVELGHVSPKTAKSLASALARLSLADALIQYHIDPNSGKIKDPRSKEFVSILDSINKGLIDPDTILLVDCTDSKLTTLGAMMDNGRFDATSGKFRDLESGSEHSIASAIKRGLIKASFTPEDLIEEKTALRDVLGDGRISPQTAVVTMSDGREMPLAEAIENGFVTYDLGVKVDRKTGKILIPKPVPVIESLVDTTEKLKFLFGVEEELIQQGHAKDTHAAVQKQIDNFDKIERGLNDNLESVEQTLDTAQRLLNERKDSKDQQYQQQYQRLRINTPELSVHLNLVKGEIADRRSGLLEVNEGLEKFEAGRDEFSAWADKVKRQMEVQKLELVARRDISELIPKFKQIEDDIRSNEHRLQSLNVSGKHATDLTEDYNKKVEQFRQQLANRNDLHVPISKKDSSSGSSHIRKDLEDAASCFEELALDASGTVARLEDLSAKNEQFDTLRQRLVAELPQLETEIQNCLKEPIDAATVNEQLEVVNIVAARAADRGSLVADFSKCGADLYRSMKNAGVENMDRLTEIEEAVAAVRKNYDEIQEEIVGRQHDLNGIYMQSQDARHSLNTLLQWVEGCEQRLRDLDEASLKPAVLDNQLQICRTIRSEVEHQRAHVQQVADACHAQAVDDGVGDLLDRFDAIAAKNDERMEELEDLAERLNALCSDAEQLELWIANVENSLRRDSGNFELSLIKAKVENLHGQKQAKEDDMEQLVARATELLNDVATTDKHYLRGKLVGLEGKWRHLAQLLSDMMAFTASRESDELLRYLERAENEISSAEQISADPETLAVQVKDHRIFHEDLQSKHRTIEDMIDRCSVMVRETPGEKADELMNQLRATRSQSELVLKASQERFSSLEECLPLASHFSKLSELQSWLNDLDADAEVIDVPDEGNVEQIKKQMDSVKSIIRTMEDHRPLLDDLEHTGQELAGLCGEDDMVAIRDDLQQVSTKFDEVRRLVREKQAQLDEVMKSSVSDVSDKLDQVFDELCYLNSQVQHAEPVAANLLALEQQISENQFISDDLIRCAGNISNVKDILSSMSSSESPITPDECDELVAKVQDMESIQSSIKKGTMERAETLQEVLANAELFHQNYGTLMGALQVTQDNLLSQDTAGVDTATITEQQRELESIVDDFNKSKHQVEDCKRLANRLMQRCGAPAAIEIRKCLEDMDSVVEDIDDGIRERETELQSSLGHADNLQNLYKGIMSWLPSCEARLKGMTTVAADARSLKIQMEELKVLKIQSEAQYGDIQNLNYIANELKRLSPLSAESILPEVKAVNTRWNNLLQDIADREVVLRRGQIELGEVDHAMDDIVGTLQQVESDLQTMDSLYGDPNCIESHIRKLQILQNSLNSHQPTIDRLNKAVENIVKRSERKTSPLLEKRAEMNETFEEVLTLARAKQNELLDRLKEVKAFTNNVADLLHWMKSYYSNLKCSPPIGALPETAQQSFDKFMSHFNELERMEEEVRMLLLSGEDMISRCHDDDVVQLKDNLDELQRYTALARNKAERHKRRLEEHLQNVREFHVSLKIQTDWLNGAEKYLSSFNHPSKLVDKVIEQIEAHRVFKEEVDNHRDTMNNLDRAGTFLKYFGRKKDTIAIKTYLINVRLRWKRLLRRVDEKEHTLVRAYREDKRFYDTWKSLCDWLDDSEKKLRSYGTGGAGKLKKKKVPTENMS